MKLFKSKKVKVYEEILMNMRWDFLTETELSVAPVHPKQSYEECFGQVIPVAKSLESFAKNLFRKTCSELRLPYEDIEYIFIKQNKEFFDYVLSLRKSSVIEGLDVIHQCKNIILPRQSNTESNTEKILIFHSDNKQKHCNCLPLDK